MVEPVFFKQTKTVSQNDHFLNFVYRILFKHSSIRFHSAIRCTRHALQGRVPLIGFSGAPFTLMAYAIEVYYSRGFCVVLNLFNEHIYPIIIRVISFGYRSHCKRSVQLDMFLTI